MTAEQAIEVLNKINTAMITAAREVNPNHGYKKLTKWWNPLSEIVRRTTTALQYAKKILSRTYNPKTKSPLHPNHATQKIRKQFKLLLRVLWNHTSKRSGQPSFRHLLSDVPDLHDIPISLNQITNNQAEAKDILSIVVLLSSLTSSLPLTDQTKLVHDMIRKLKRIGHAKQQRNIRQRLSEFTKREVRAVQLGKTKRSIQRLSIAKK
jgi:hypothetical protein